MSYARKDRRDGGSVLDARAPQRPAHLRIIVKIRLKLQEFQVSVRNCRRDVLTRVQFSNLRV